MGGAEALVLALVLALAGVACGSSILRGGTRLGLLALALCAVLLALLHRCEVLVL